MRHAAPLALLTALALAGTAGAGSPSIPGTTRTFGGLTGGDRLGTPGSAVPQPTLRSDVGLAPGVLFGGTGHSRDVEPLPLPAGNPGRLVFTAEGASSSPAEANMDLDGTWTLSGGTALRPAAGQAPGLTLGKGRVSGTGGCNRLSGAFQVEGDTLILGPLASTRRACAPEVNRQEGAFLTFLGRPLTARVEALTLTLTGTDGKTLTFRRAGVTGGTGPQGGSVGSAPTPTPPATPPAHAQGGAYTLATVNGQAAPRTSRPVTLTLQGGNVSGSDGCNSFGGAYRLEEGRLVLVSPLIGTRMACPDGDGNLNLSAVLRARPTLTVMPTGLTLTVNGETLEFSRKP